MYPATSPSPIHLDRSAVLIVVYCDEHEWFKSARFHLDEARDAACTHEEREHPGDNRHREARRHRELRRVAAATQTETYETTPKV